MSAVKFYALGQIRYQTEKLSAGPQKTSTITLGMIYNNLIFK